MFVSFAPFRLWWLWWWWWKWPSWRRRCCLYHQCRRRRRPWRWPSAARRGGGRRSPLPFPLCRSRGGRTSRSYLGNAHIFTMVAKQISVILAHKPCQAPPECLPDCAVDSEVYCAVRDEEEVVEVDEDHVGDGHVGAAKGGAVLVVLLPGALGVHSL